ncbi:hypothetical protein [Phycicoccus duodecadis]|uniref:ARB-07466-like C-terminal domain-containing protein n=1 Tax=Phycicoccus duodecadis TaxID=173053 RepID=A0A2N3YKY7_9MICO|nr:hypothetical protein [Phycicoccus duodecadis]PKW27527.1 hypothetical protein ATL31_2373 [Phycicoccus duodecadis]
MASLGVIGGAAVALAVPAEQADAQADGARAAAPAAMVLAQRAAPQAASRSLTRSAPAPAVSAPTGAAPQLPDAVGIAGVKAVAKPKPKPEPAPSSPAGAQSAASAAVGSWSGTITARCSNIGLIPNAQRLCSAVDVTFGPPTIGGRRASNDEHGTGQATDIMIANAAQGDAIAAWVQAHVSEFNVKYLIWQQRYWAPGEGWRLMEDRGSPTANHMDHVHVTMNF